MIDEKTKKYFTEARQGLLDGLQSLSPSKDPDWIPLLEGFALFEARLRSEISSKEDVLSEFLLYTLAPELMAPPPSCGVLELMGPTGIHIKKYSELVSGGIRWRINGQVNLTQAEIYNTKLVWEPSSFYLFEIIHPETELQVYICADFTTSQRIIADIILAGQKVINFSTGAEVGEVIFDDNINLFDTIANPFSELYDYKWLQVKYQFFRLKLNIVEDKMLLAIKRYGLVKELPLNIFKLNCIPASNLFKTVASPVKIVPEQIEYECLTPYQQYRIEEIVLFNTEIKLTLGRDYFISNGNKVTFPARFDGKIALFSLLCTQAHHNTEELFVFEDLNYVQGKLIKVITPESIQLSSKWDILKLYNANLFNNYYRENKLLDFVKQVMELFDETNHIENINIVNDTTIIKEQGCFGIVNTVTINIQLDLTNIIFGLVWGRILLKLLPFNIKGQVIIRDVNRVFKVINGFI